MKIFEDDGLEAAIDLVSGHSIIDDAVTNFDDAVKQASFNDVAGFEKRLADLVYRWTKIDLELRELYYSSVQFNEDISRMEITNNEGTENGND